MSEEAKLDEKTMELILELRSLMEDMTEEQRLRVQQEVMRFFCSRCGSRSVPCYCCMDD